MEIFHRAHSGASMNPTLDAIDLLEVIPAGTNPVRPGDVVLFRPPNWTEDVVHRVTSIREDWIRTRGDNSPEEDPWLLQHEEIEGIVIAAWRGNTRRRITGARRGLFRAKAVRIARRIDSIISAPLRPVYRFVSSMDLSSLLPQSLQPRVITCQVESGTSRRIVLGNRIVGRYNDNAGAWSIRRPYRLFISPSSPPEGEDQGEGGL